MKREDDAFQTVHALLRCRSGMAALTVELYEEALVGVGGAVAAPRRPCMDSLVNLMKLDAILLFHRNIQKAGSMNKL